MLRSMRRKGVALFALAGAIALLLPVAPLAAPSLFLRASRAALAPRAAPAPRAALRRSSLLVVWKRMPAEKHSNCLRNCWATTRGRSRASHARQPAGAATLPSSGSCCCGATGCPRATGCPLPRWQGVAPRAAIAPRANVALLSGRAIKASHIIVMDRVEECVDENYALAHPPTHLTDVLNSAPVIEIHNERMCPEAAGTASVADLVKQQSGGNLVSRRPLAAVLFQSRGE